MTFPHFHGLANGSPVSIHFHCEPCRWATTDLAQWNAHLAICPAIARTREITPPREIAAAIANDFFAKMIETRSLARAEDREAEVNECLVMLISQIEAAIIEARKFSVPLSNL